MLSSFMNRRKVKKISLFDAALRRAQSPPSPGAQQDTILPDVRPKKGRSMGNPLSMLKSTPRQSSPQVHLPDFPHEPSEWFPHEIFGGGEFQRQEAGASGSDLELQADEYDFDDDEVVLIEREGGEPLEESKALPPVPRLQSPYSPVASAANSTDQLSLPPHARKHAPAPIKIPNNLSKVQIARSASAGVGASSALYNSARPSSNAALSPSRPESFISSEDLSSISGTTLARALIANSFILSNDNPRSRYRSGGANAASTGAVRQDMVRQDSATLPRGENPLINSPYWKDKRISGGEIVVTPDSGRGSPIPPVPPLPQNMDMALGAGFGASTSTRSSMSDMKRSSLPSESPTIRGFEETRATKLRPERQSTLRRISRISEVLSTPGQSLPNTPERQGRSTTSEQAATPKSTNTLDEGMLSAQSAAKSSAGRFTEAPTSAGSGDDIDNVLNDYRFISPLKSAFPTYLHSPESVLTSASITSPYSLASSRASTTAAGSMTGTSATAASPQSQASSVRGKKLQELDIKQTFDTGAVRLPRNSSNLRPGLLPIGERPRSLNIPQSPISRRSDDSGRSSGHRQSLSISSRGSPYEAGVGSPDLLDFMLLPHQSAGTAGSGTAPRPNPIQVIRESQDLSLDLTDSSDSSAAASADAYYRQTFPETPLAFSPLWSSSTPQLPKTSSAVMDEIRPGMPRSASSYHRGVRGRVGMFAGTPKRTTSLTSIGVKRLPLSSAKPEMSPIPSTPAPLSGCSETDQRDHTFGSRIHSPSEPPWSARSGTNPSSACMSGTTAASNSEINSTRQGGETSTLTTPNTPSVKPRDSVDVSSLRSFTTGARSSYTSANTSTTELTETLNGSTPKRGSPRVKPLPQKPKPAPIEVPRHSSRSPSPGPVLDRRAQEESRTKFSESPEPIPEVQLAPPPTQPAQQPSQPQPLQRLPQLPQPQPSTQPQPQLSQQQVPPQPPLHLLPIGPAPGTAPGPALHISPATPASSSSTPQHASRTTAFSFLRQSFGDTSAADSEGQLPPPSYQHAIQTKAHTEPEQATAPSLALPAYGRSRSHSELPDPQWSSLVANPPVGFQPEQRRPSITAEPAATRRVGRSRPPLPAGPRKPSAGNASIMGMSNRNGSVSSLNAFAGPEHISNKSSIHSANHRPRKFQVTPVRWRGIPMDVAKWTFTSQQLQEIVSRAIKQSAEPSSIRLLKIETLDREMPEEMHRLEMLSTDVKARFKMAVARRRSLLGGLTEHATGIEVMDPTTLSHIIEELGEVSANIEELSEELHSVSDQIAQLKRLCDIHSASALSMALRKLNTSFLRQATETQILRDKVSILESERDDAWTHAENVCKEFDDFTDKVGSPAASDQNSRRASRITAARQSSVRLSKSGLRAQSANGRRSSIQRNSQLFSAALPSSSKASQNVPRVPPIPHRPAFIQTTNLPLRGHSSAGGGTYTEMTPTTETRALAQAQKELCEMLGIDVRDVKGRPRSHSMSNMNSTSPTLGHTRTRRNSDANPGSPNDLENYLDPMIDSLLPPGY